MRHLAPHERRLLDGPRDRIVPVSPVDIIRIVNERGV